MMRRPLLLLLAGLLTVMVWASPASAHATLVGADPADGSLLDDSPETVALTFSEPVSVDASTVEFIDAEGNRLDATIIGHGESEAVLVISLEDAPDGLYSLRWSAFSNSDGHVTRGMLVWGIGPGADLSQAEFAEPSDPVSPIEVMLRWVMLVGFGLIAGVLMMHRLVLTPVRARFSGGQDQAWHDAVSASFGRIVRLAASAAAGAGVGLVAFQLIVAWTSGNQSLAATVDTTLLSTAWGQWALLRAAALVAVWALVMRRGVRAALSTLILLTAVAVAQSAGGHAAGTETAVFSTVNDFVHLASSMTWVGGLVLLAVLARLDDERSSRLRAAAIAAFSPVAFMMVSVAIVTGFLAVGDQARSIDAAISTLYGQAMIGKLMLVALMVGAAILIRREFGHEAAPSRLRVEAVAGILAVGLVALMTATTPANGVEWRPAVAQGSRQLAVVTNDIQIGVSISPNAPGQNFVLIDTATVRRPALAPIDKVIARVRSTDVDLAGTSFDVPATDRDGEYELATTAFSVSGSYALEVVVRRTGLPDEVAVFDWTVADPSPREVIVSEKALAPVTTTLAGAGAVVLAAILAAQAGVAIRRDRRTRSLESFAHMSETASEVES